MNETNRIEVHLGSRSFGHIRFERRSDCVHFELARPFDVGMRALITVANERMSRASKGTAVAGPREIATQYTAAFMIAAQLEGALKPPYATKDVVATVSEFQQLEAILWTTYVDDIQLPPCWHATRAEVLMAIRDEVASGAAHDHLRKRIEPKG